MLDTSSWTLIDLLFALGVVVSITLGAWRGLLKESLSLLGWVVAYFAAHWFAVPGARLVPIGEPGSRTNVLAGMAVVFVAALMAWALLTWLLTQMIRSSVLSGADRLMGMVFGFLRGLLIALVVCTLVDMTPLTRWEPWQASRSVAWLRVFLAGLRPVLPEQVVKFLPRQS